MKKVVVVGGARIPFVKSFSAFEDKSNKDLMTNTLQLLVKKYHLEGKKLGDVALGAVMKNPNDWNLARECVLGSELDPHTPAYDLQRACGTSLEAALNIANKIRMGQIDVGIAGGTDTNSDLPFLYRQKFRNRFLKMRKAKNIFGKLGAFVGFFPTELMPDIPSATEPRTGLTMGEHCEQMAKEWKISRQEQDELAFQSQKNAAKAYEENFYKDLVYPYAGVGRDTFVRPDTSLEKLAKLQPAFDKKNGTLTAGNSTPLTDGASAVLLASEEYARANNLPIQAYFIDAQVAAVNFAGGEEGLLMAPTYAVAEMIKRNNLSLQSFDLYEIHEAFAAQVLCTLKAWESEEYCQKRLKQGALGKIDRNKMNLKGGSLALGHPFAATGSRIIATLAKQLEEKRNAHGLISICTGGGMGVAAILKSPQ